MLEQASSFSYAREVGTRRAAQDLVYRMFATAVIEHYCEAFPERADALSWLFRPRRRHTLLTELGRIARPKSAGNGALTWSEEDLSEMIDAALGLAETRPSTKIGVKWLRERRLHTRKGRAA